MPGCPLICCPSTSAGTGHLDMQPGTTQNAVSVLHFPWATAVPEDLLEGRALGQIDSKWYDDFEHVYELCLDK